MPKVKINNGREIRLSEDLLERRRVQPEHERSDPREYLDERGSRAFSPRGKDVLLPSLRESCGLRKPNLVCTVGIPPARIAHEAQI